MSDPGGTVGSSVVSSGEIVGFRAVTETVFSSPKGGGVGRHVRRSTSFPYPTDRERSGHTIRTRSVTQKKYATLQTGNLKHLKTLKRATFKRIVISVVDKRVSRWRPIGSEL